MIDELVELLRRQTATTEQLELRLRALELVVAADEQRFVSLALDELERASEELGALELTRVLALSVAGMSPDVTATELQAAVRDDREALLLGHAVDGLRQASHRLADARARTHAVVVRGANEVRAKLQAAERFASI